MDAPKILTTSNLLELEKDSDFSMTGAETVTDVEFDLITTLRFDRTDSCELRPAETEVVGRALEEDMSPYDRAEPGKRLDKLLEQMQ